MNDEAYGWWLSGLIDGEGCFRIHKQRRGTYYAPTFSLKLRDDDLPLLREIVIRTGIGSIQYDSNRSGNSRPCAIWRANTRESTEALAMLLEKYPLRSRKAKDFEHWHEAVRVRATMPRGNRWHGPRDWSPLIRLKLRIEQARVYVPPKRG